MTASKEQRAMKKEIASQLGVSHMNMNKAKGRFQGSRHTTQAKGPIIPPNSKKGTVNAATGKKAVGKMKKTKKMKQPKGISAKTKNRLHGSSKTRTSKTKMNYGKNY